MVGRSLMERHCEEELNRGVFLVSIFISGARLGGKCFLVGSEDERRVRQRWG